ncbi:mycothiol synthase [Galbitalea soli]|uniref:Mycothiol acetyltransferase n=1 Tax=Galbitalea soli TaxID=1268042 RepID=A0A7C9TUD0_9MICO|nr:mycothiol synthase [Galbitalea soli]NEM92323.1 mycothiol synthase [Galbitalea soli]NYJ31721.1 mycothiol synthase [Galbitalea soli]
MSASPSAPEPSVRPLPSWLDSLIAECRAVDGTPPYSDQAIVDYRMTTRELLAIDEVAAALVARPPGDTTEAEFAVRPEARGHGIGTRLLAELLRESHGGLRVWAHGDHPAARRLAARFGLVPARELLHLAAELGQADRPASAEAAPAAGTAPTAPTAATHPTTSTALDGYRLAVFRAGVDDGDWVALNALVFAAHPEQGAVTRADLDQLRAEPWFRADDMLLLWAGAELVGYCWLKIEGTLGEFYVVGLHPDRQGAGLGGALFDAGLAHLRRLGVARAHLYVEGDNHPALALYRSRGFHDDQIDIQYEWRG